MLTANKLKLIFFNEAKHNQEGNITQYLSPTDLIHLSKISTEANRLHKTKIRQICFSRFIQFMSHPDILGKPIIDNEEPFVISRYPNENDLINLKKTDSISNVLDKISSSLFLDLKFNFMNQKVKAPFKLLFIPEIFQLSELHESIRNMLKNMCYLYSTPLLQNILSAINKNVTLDSEGNLDPVFVASVKQYYALPYKIARLSITPTLQIKTDRDPGARRLMDDLYYYFTFNDVNYKTLQLLVDHKIIYFLQKKYQGPGYEYFENPIMEAAYRGNLKLFELLSHALQAQHHYSFYFYGEIINYNNNNHGTDNHRSPLMAAARANRINIVKKIVDDEKTVASDLMKTDERSWTALMHASCKGNVEVVDLMIKKASSLGLVKTLVNVCGTNNDTALTVAAYNGYLEVVQQLLPFIDQNLPSINQVEVALQLARRREHGAIINFLHPLLQEEEKPTRKQCCLM